MSNERREDWGEVADEHCEYRAPAALYSLLPALLLLRGH